MICKCILEMNTTTCWLCIGLQGVVARRRCQQTQTKAPSGLNPATPAPRSPCDTRRTRDGPSWKVSTPPRPRKSQSSSNGSAAGLVSNAHKSQATGVKLWRLAHLRDEQLQTARDELRARDLLSMCMIHGAWMRFYNPMVEKHSCTIPHEQTELYQ
jgi:hypothetical protein